jgi:hypothetical protein
LESFKKYQLLTEVFSKGESFNYSELVTQIKLAYKNQFKSDLGRNRIVDLITDFKNNGWLIQPKAKAPYTIGEFQNSQNEVTF